MKNRVAYEKMCNAKIALKISKIKKLIRNFSPLKGEKFKEMDDLTQS